MAERCGLSKSTIGRIWRAFELKPHRQDRFKLSTDPQFVEQVYDIVRLYLNPPEAAVVFCVDEKSQVQALARSQPTFPMMPVMPEKRTHNYVRHGTTSLFAAFNTIDGTVISSIHRRHRSIEFKKFLSKMDTEIPDNLDMHLVCDNYGTHKSPSIVKWLDAHPRFHMHFTPTYSSWINQVERFFGYARPTFSTAAITAASRHSKPTSAHGSKTGTKIPRHLSGPRQPNRSSTPSDDFHNELPTQDTRRYTGGRSTDLSSWELVCLDSACT